MKSLNIENLITLICDEMATDLTPSQLKKLETTLYKSFRNLKVIEECREIEVTQFGGDVGLVRLFIASKRLAGRTESTLEAYNFEIWIARTCIGKCFKDIETLDVKAYLAKMMERGLSPCTINNKRRYLNSFFSWLHEEGFIEKNPVARIDSVKEPERHKRAFSIKEIEAMRVACKGKRDRALFEFLLATGLRVSELTSLKVSDIDFVRRKFRVIGKGNKERIAFFDGVAEFYLQRYIDWRIENENTTIDELENKPLFAKVKAPFTALENNGVRAMLKRIAEQAGIENVHPHKFRRTFATTALHRQMPIEKVQGLLGHTKIETTLLYSDNQSDLEQSYKTYIA